MPELADRDVALVRADNPGMLTLEGTNTWILGRDPAWLVDPGPALDPHLDALAAELARRGGLGGIAITHDHADHVEALAPLLERCGSVPVGAARGAADVLLGDGDAFGPLRVLATPGHATDHLAYLAGDVCFSGDAVLGHGSVFIAPDPGAMAGYLAALARLRALAPALICPGHGPLVRDPVAHVDGYIAHRLDRERRLIAALERGLREEAPLLDAVWDDVPAPLRPIAAVTLRAHLDKLREEGRLPPER